MSALFPLVLCGIANNIRSKTDFDEDTDLHLYTYVMMSHGLGADDEYAYYFIEQLNKIGDDIIKSVDEDGNTLLHMLCTHSCQKSSRFCYKIFQYLIIRGVDVQIKNNNGNTCLQELEGLNQNGSDGCPCGNERNHNSMFLYF